MIPFCWQYLKAIFGIITHFLPGYKKIFIKDLKGEATSIKQEIQTVYPPLNKD